MTDIEWKLMKTKMELRRRKEQYWLGKVKSFLQKGALCAGLVGATVLLTGAYDGPQRLIETTYTVQENDTLWDIGEVYLEKNTGGKRHIWEFIEGMKELNPELVKSKGQIYPGQVLRVNYWVKDGEQ